VDNSPSLSTEASDQVLRRFVGFGRRLREEGIAVNPAAMVDLCRALQYIDFSAMSDVKAAARTTLINRRENLPAFERIFDQYWLHTDPADTPDHAVEDAETGAAGVKPAAHTPESLLLAGQEPAVEAEQGGQYETTGYSDRDVITRKDLGSLDAAEIERARALIAELVKALANRPGRRFQAARRGSAIDFRRSFRRNLQQGFSGLELKVRKPRIKKPRLMLLCDVSGSMERYSRFLLDFIYALQHQLPAIEAAVFATHMTPVSPYLKRHELDNSLSELATHARGWGGGTDIGQALAEFNRHYACDLARSKTVMVILSDGWDRGDADTMREEIAGLRRRVDKLIWLNPLLGDSGYQPLCRGIETALPHLDHFLPAHNLESLANVAELLRKS